MLSYRKKSNTRDTIMKAARLQAYGDVDQFKLEEVPDPKPGPGEVLIKIAASGLNPVDLYVRQGVMSQYIPLELPATLGIDAAGSVAESGGKFQRDELAH